MIKLNNKEKININNLNSNSFKTIIIKCDKDLNNIIKIFFNNEYFYNIYNQYQILIIDNDTSNNTILQLKELIEIDYLIKIEFIIIDNLDNINDIQNTINETIINYKLLYKYNSKNIKDLVMIKMIDNLDIKDKQNIMDDIYKNYPNIDKYENDRIIFESFLNDNLNIALSSRKQFLHRNTLIYKLDRFLENTNLDLREFNDAMTYKLYLYCKV